MKKITVVVIIVLLAMLLSACGLWSLRNPTTRIQPVPIPPPTQEHVLPTLPAPEPPLQGPSEVVEFEVIEDLTGMNLIDHDLDGSTILEPIEFTTLLLGREFATVTIVSYAELFVQDGFIFNDAWAIELYYFARRHESAVESVIWSAAADITEGYFFPDSVLTVGPVRASEDHQTAFMVIVEELRSGHMRICFYMAQNVPGTDEVVLLDVVLFPGLWERQDNIVLAELSRHFGVDLGVYIADYLHPDASPVVSA